MILKQFYLGCLSQASYLIADEAQGEAVLVDPRRDVDLYLEEAKQLGVKIRHVLLTHFHADFVSGHLELRKATGADIRMGAKATPEYPFTPMRDGDVLEVGRVRIKALETPGHTPESVCYAVYEGESATPHAILTGDTLFIGDVGRPDLMASSGMTAEALAGNLYDSLRNKILTLPDSVIIYPGHGAGSMCGKNLSSETSSTLGEQRTFNYLLRSDLGREDFIRLVTADQPVAPAYFGYDAWYNRQERVTLDENLERVLVPLSIADVLRREAEGAQLLDVRDPFAFAKRHLRNSINIGLEGSFATWAGTLLDRERPLVILAEPGREREAALRLGRIGFDRVQGFLKGGPDDAGLPADLMRSVGRVSAEELGKRLTGAAPPLVLDIRNPREREAMQIPATLHIPLGELASRFRDVPAGREIVVHCAAGYRSSMAASMLRAHGFTEVEDLIGGIAAWERAGLPLQAEAAV